MSENQLLAVRCALGLDKDHTLTIRYSNDYHQMVSMIIIKSENGQTVCEMSINQGVWTANLLNYVNKMAFQSVTLKDLVS